MIYAQHEESLLGIGNTYACYLFSKCAAGKPFNHTVNNVRCLYFQDKWSRGYVCATYYHNPISYKLVSGKLSFHNTICLRFIKPIFVRHVTGGSSPCMITPHSGHNPHLQYCCEMSESQLNVFMSISRRKRISGLMLDRAANLYPDGLSCCAVDSIFIQAAQSHRGSKIFWRTCRMDFVELSGLYVNYPEYNRRLVGPTTSTRLNISHTDGMLNMLKTDPRAMAAIMNAKNPVMSGGRTERTKWMPHILT